MTYHIEILILSNQSHHISNKHTITLIRVIHHLFNHFLPLFKLSIIPWQTVEYPRENLQIVKPHEKIHFPIMEMLDSWFRVIAWTPPPWLAIRRRRAILDILALAKSDSFRAAEKTRQMSGYLNLLRLVYKYNRVVWWWVSIQ